MLRSVRIIRMVQCVMTSGMSWRPEWSAGNSDTLEMVCNANLLFGCYTYLCILKGDSIISGSRHC